MIKNYQIITLILLLISIFASAQKVKTAKETKIQNSPKDTINIKTFKAGNGWGYDIYVKGKKYIHQENIPAIQGIRSFKTETDAKKTAELTKSKIRKNIMPPTISIKELDSIGIK